GVGGVGLETEVIREDPQPNETCEPAQEDPGGDEKGPAHASVDVIVLDGLAERAAGAPHEKGLDEEVDVAVEHAIHVPNLFFRPMIFDELIRVQHVAADLAAKRDIALLASELV